MCRRTDNALNSIAHKLYEALRLIRSQYGQQLPENEANMFGEAIISIGQRLHPT